jgi:tetratricopeptide (TPR) repeat protein
MNRMNANHKSSHASPRGRKKTSSGVLATLERLTGKKPCPDYLRNIANKYLVHPDLFPKNCKSNKEKLASENADEIMMNALTLDEAFKGKTEIVVAIINGKLEGTKLENSLDEAQRENKRRYEVYACWEHHFPALQMILTSDSLDLRKERLDEKLRTIVPSQSTKPILPFALRAIQNLETIEERGWLGRLTANEYAEQADAYMALGDYSKADERSRKAIEVDPDHARAWFIRVMVALRQRNSSAHEMQYYQMIVTEASEPMSSQESWALQMANDNGAQAAYFHEKLNEILPKALLNWPRKNREQYDHPDEYVYVRNLFIDQVFMTAISKHKDGNDVLPFNDDEKPLLSRLIAERDKNSSSFFFLDRNLLARNLKLLHLRWILKLDGYAEHWAEWSRQAMEYMNFSPSYFEENILCKEEMSRIWRRHERINNGNTSIPSILLQWQQNCEARSIDILLPQYVCLFDEQWVQNDYFGCYQTAELCKKVIPSDNKSRNMVSHPSDELSISVPAYRFVYWQYISTLSIVKASIAGKEISDEMFSVLTSASELRVIFQETSDDWQWAWYQEFDGGGGMDGRETPYDTYMDDSNTDLCDEAIWRKAIEAQLAITIDSSRKDSLRKALAILKSKGEESL